MIIRGDYHTHTTYSDGKSSIEDNIKSAIEKGLDTVAITDHGPGHVFFGCSYDGFKEQREIILELREKYTEIEILHGVEANFMDFKGNIDIKDSFMDFFDFVCVGFHNGIIPRDLRSKVDFYPLRGLNFISSRYKKSVDKRATEAIINATRNYDIKFVSHPGAKFGVDMELLQSKMNTDVLLEINERHKKLSLDYLKEIDNPDINLIINSDSHLAPNVGVVDWAINTAKEASIDKTRIYNMR